jgi:exocyst complex component 6
MPLIFHRFRNFISSHSNTSRSKEEDQILSRLPESIHAVRRAELAFTLLGKGDEFVQYYEQNRFGETKIAGDKEEKTERKSVLSSLTGDDVSIGTDRVYFAKTLPHLAASVTGFTAVEAALELGNFADEDGTSTEQNLKTTVAGTKSGAVNAVSFRESSERYERALITELGNLFRGRATRACLVELVRYSMLVSVLRAALKIVHPSSTTRRFDKDLLALDQDILVTAVKLAQDEQLRATGAIVSEDPKVPLLVADSLSKEAINRQTVPGIPDPEVIGLPFGLSQMIQKPQQAELEFQEQARTSFNRAPFDESYRFSQSVPVVLRSIHARAITIAAFALSQVELGQKFPEKKCSPAAGYVLDCVEEMVNVAAVGMKDSHNVVEEGSVEKAVQVMANISALQHCLPRLFGTLIRGMCHIGLIQADEIDATFAYAERALKGADKACDAQVGSTYGLVYEICRNKIDSHINYALENFQWVAKSARDMPNAYCEGLIGYLRSVFSSLGPMDEGSRAGLHFSCMGHVAERIVKLLSGKPGDTTTFDESSIAPIARIDAFGIKNLHLDCEEFERFADTTGIPQLRDCFSEVRILTSFMLDKDLPTLLLSDNAASRRRKYPILSLDKVANILEKYVGTGLVSITLYSVTCLVACSHSLHSVALGRQAHGRCWA